MPFARPIKPAQVAGASSALPGMRRLAELLLKTGLRGSPVIVSGNFYTESGAIAGAGVLLAGFASEDWHNLAASGVAKTLSAGIPIGQPNAIIIPQGAPLSDGNIGVHLAEPDTIFEGNFGTTDVATLPAAADIGVIYGLTKEVSSGIWYVDKAKTTVGGGAIVTVVALHSQDTPAAGTRVLFRVNQANQLFNQ